MRTIRMIGQLNKKKGFTLVELIMVMSVIAILVAAFYVASKPQKRVGETNDARRKNDAQSIEQAIKIAATDSETMSSDLKNLTENVPYAIVKVGGSVDGQYSCTVLGISIDKKDISTSLINYLPQMPIDPDLAASSNETGYYIVRRGSSYDVEPCNTYRLAATTGSKQMCGDGYCGSSESCASCPQDCGACPAVCGNNVREGSEICDDGDVVTEYCGDGETQNGSSYCNADCSSTISLSETCDDGNSSNLDNCLNTCLVASCGDTYCNGSETCSDCSGDCGACQQAYTAGPTFPGTAANANDNGGAYAWTNTGNILADDAAFSFYQSVLTNNYDNTAKLIKADGTYASENKALPGYWTGSWAVYDYGGNGSLWGETWTPADINDADFGFALSATAEDLGYSQNLKATNFGFNIPLTATITGIKVQVEKYTYSKSPTSSGRVDYVKITVYYNN